MKRIAAVVQNDKPTWQPVDLDVAASVHFIGPASRDNPLSQVRTKLMGAVRFHDSKIKWSRITLQLVGKAGIHHHVASKTLHSGLQGLGHLDDGSGTTHLETIVTICNVEKELIFNGEESIEFGLHLPPDLPPSIRAKHAFVEYSLIANLSAGPFKKQRIQRSVRIRRHYLPGPSAMIPSVEHHGLEGWFEWWAEVPKATAVEAGEIVVALRWSIEKERVAVDRVELTLEELEHYRFATKAGVCVLPPNMTRFPSFAYHPSHTSHSSDTHFIRSPFVPHLQKHHYSPFLEIKYRLLLTVHFVATDHHLTITPFKRQFPIVITDYPNSVTQDTLTEDDVSTSYTSRTSAGVGADDAVPIDFDLPEYTPQYQEHDPNG